MKKLLLPILLFCSLISFAQLEAGNYQYGYKVKCDSCFIDGKLKVTAATVGSATQVYVKGSDNYMKLMAISLVGGSSTVNQLQFTVAADGDSAFVNAAFIGWPGVIVIREGEEQALTTQYIYDSALGKVTLRPSALAGEKITIKYGNYITTISGSGGSGGGGYVPPAVLRDLVFQTLSTAVGLTTGPPRKYGGGSSCTSYDNYGLSDSSATAGTDFYIEWQKIGTESENCIVGLNSTHTNQRYRTSTTNNFELGAMIYANQLWVLDGTADMANTGITITGDIHLAIFRTGTTYTLQTSTSGTAGTWTVRYTYTGFATSPQMWAAFSIPCYTFVDELKAYNFH